MTDVDTPEDWEVKDEDETRLKLPLVRGVKCPRCEQRLWSRYGHDFHYCKCQYTFVDGGRGYLRYGYGDPFSGEATHGSPEIITIDSSDPAAFDDGHIDVRRMR